MYGHSVHDDRSRTGRITAAAVMFEQDMAAHTKYPSNRSRSRSPHPWQPESGEEAAEARAHETPEQLEAAALKKMQEALTQSKIGGRLQKLCEDGTMRGDEFDYKALAVLHGLPEGLQLQVMDHLENDRVFLMNSRSKSGFLVSACEKARLGALDCRGFMLQDPWRMRLLQNARPKRASIDLVSESVWLTKHGGEPARLLIDVSVDKSLGSGSIALAVNLANTSETIKKRLAVIGVQIPIHKMRLKASGIGFLKDTNSLGFYNLQSGSELQLMCKTRAGSALKKDQSDGFDPRFCTAAPPVPAV